MHDTATKRAAIKAVPTARRIEWARAHREPCRICAKYGKTRDDCTYPSHMWGARLDLAFADLCDGRALPETAATVITATETTQAVIRESSAQQAMERTTIALDEPEDDRTADDLAAALRAALKASKPAVDEAAVRAIVAEAVRDIQPQTARMEVTVNKDGERSTTDVGLTHERFPALLKAINSRVNVWIAGPTGSGKTHAVEQAARALGLPFRFNGAIDTEYKLSGFVDASGRIVSTAFRDAFTNGGVYLFDEVDVSMPSAVLAFNAALSNGACDFPGLDRPVTRHPDFRCVAGANTYGNGATMEYVGRTKMDAAFLDRFVFLSWDYDEKLERTLCPDSDWVAYVQKLRAIAKNRGLKVIISPRASFNGAALLASGMSRDEVIHMTIRNKMTAESASALGL